MNLTNLYHLQAEFDESIKYDEPDRINLLFVAFKVELYELLNETRCFKFWSKNFKKPRTVVHQFERVVFPNGEIKPLRNPTLEEFVDGLHFLLSIGNYLDFSHLYPDVEAFVPKLGDDEWTLLQQFDAVEESLKTLKVYRVDYIYEQTVQLYLGIAEMLDFSDKEVADAYMDKHKVNYQRQKEGY